jgi:hypothetical protein
VAIVQISRITQRKGLASDLPQPLAGAELGWAVDERKLFIGNGTLEDGAPVIGNTEVLTEFSDILGFATSYIYRGEAAGYTAQTGATLGTPVAQSIQSRLDSYAVITDFGPVGDGITDVTSDINRALYQIYCREVNPAIRRSLFFPAGVYIITDTLDIPPYAKLYGEGAESTIIYFNVQNWTSAISYAASVLVYNVSTGFYYRSNFIVPVGKNIGDNNPDGDPYWTQETLPDYIFRTADSLQQIDANIETNGALPPGNVEISGMKFVTNRTNSAGLIQNASMCLFDAVSFEGSLGEVDLTTAGAGAKAIDWASTSSSISSNVTFNNCKFSKFTYATNTDQQIKGVTFSNSEFTTLYQGILLGGVTPVDGGATGVRVVQNTFDNVYKEGIVIENVSLNCSAYNTFYDVGNHFQGSGTPETAIISLDGDNNVSVGDMFERTTANSGDLHPRIALNNRNNMAMSMNARGLTFYQAGTAVDTFSNTLDLGTYQRTAGIEDTLVNNTTNDLVVVSQTGLAPIYSFRIDYTVIRGTAHRTGTIVASSGVGFSYTDDFTENSTTGVTLTLVDNTGDVTVSYTTTSTGTNGSIKYSITNLG